MADDLKPPPNYWAITSFWCGLVGFVLSLTAPIPFIPLISFISLPLGLVALMVGWIGRNRPNARNDKMAVRQIEWGIGLGCAGWIIQIVTVIVTIFIVAGLLVTLFGSFIGILQPTPTP